MLERREFLKLSGILAGGAVIALATAPSANEWSDAGVATTGESQPPIYRFHGHARSGCSFRPELTDLWSGGGAQLPDYL